MQKKRGFTLIELLVVIAIIAILAAILFPVLGAAKKRAQMVGCINNLKQLSTAMRRYADDFSGVMPEDGPKGHIRGDKTPVPIDWCGCQGARQWVYPNQGQIWRYTKNEKIYMCPSDLKREPDQILDNAVPLGSEKYDYPLSYTMNEYLSRKIIDTVPSLSKCMLLIHENRSGRESLSSGGSKDWGINDGTYWPDPNGQDVPGGVHYDGTTLAYGDGHACWKSRKALLAEKTSWVRQPHVN